MLLLDNPVQPYAWGAVDGLASLVGRAPSGGHEAELWVGAHPVAPSRLAAEPGTTLDEVIAADPRGTLGSRLAERVGDRLPFLLKVLAVGESLSLQAHPSAAQAEAGWRREEAAGIPLTAPQRTYKDPSAKPELLVALLDTWALCGFREPAKAVELVRRLEAPALEPLVDVLGRGGEAATGGALRWLLDMEGERRDVVAAEARVRAGAVADASADDPFAWVARLASEHPGDPGCVAPLLLELVHLRPGDAIHLPAGYLHAYLRGAGVEIMAASDNVLRGGLTPKHVDVAALFEILVLTPGLPAAVEAHDVAAGIRSYDVGEPAFCLTRICPTEASGPVTVGPDGPGVLLATGGPATASAGTQGLDLAGGVAAFVGATDGPVTVDGPGTIWWATTGPALRS